jgi:hypothetical protein
LWARCGHRGAYAHGRLSAARRPCSRCTHSRACPPATGAVTVRVPVTAPEVDGWDMCCCRGALHTSAVRRLPSLPRPPLLLPGLPLQSSGGRAEGVLKLLQNSLESGGYRMAYEHDATRKGVREL